MRQCILPIAVLTFSVVSDALTARPDEIPPDAGLEARARSLSRQLHCMACPNHSIDDSDAPFARYDVMSESPSDFSGIRTPRADS